MERYRNYSDYLKERYGEKVYKIPVSLPVTCPNRDGTIGARGCIFCAGDGSGAFAADRALDRIEIAEDRDLTKYIL